jgi:hypothetical protein
MHVFFSRWVGQRTALWARNGQFDPDGPCVTSPWPHKFVIAGSGGLDKILPTP